MCPPSFGIIMCPSSFGKRPFAKNQGPIIEQHATEILEHTHTSSHKKIDPLLVWHRPFNYTSKSKALSSFEHQVITYARYVDPMQLVQ